MCDEMHIIDILFDIKTEKRNLVLFYLQSAGLAEEDGGTGPIRRKSQPQKDYREFH